MVFDQNKPAFCFDVSVLFNEPKLLKFRRRWRRGKRVARFSALQRAEIAEMTRHLRAAARRFRVSVLFNEPKLLKFPRSITRAFSTACFSALQRAEIAEIVVED